MPRQENAKQVNVVMTEEKCQELDEFCERTGLSRNAAMNKARDLLLVDELKVKAPELTGSIDDFVTHINQLLSLYKNSIEHGLLADVRARADVKGQLEGMATLAETNRNLQADLNKITEQKVALEAKATEQSKTISELTLTISNLKEKLEEAESYKTIILEVQMQNLELKQTIVDLKNSHAEEIKKLQDEQRAMMLEFLKASK